jgi:hypothetical protein
MGQVAQNGELDLLIMLYQLRKVSDKYTYPKQKTYEIRTIFNKV